MSKILVVEDNDLNLIMVQDLLELAGHEIIEAKDANLGIQLAKDIRPDLILMDLHLPGLSGYDATRIIKADSNIQKIPVIAFTALVTHEDKDHAFQAGCDGFISKPINIETFVSTINQYIQMGAVS